MATWAEQLIILVPNPVRSVIFKMDKTSLSKQFCGSPPLPRCTRLRCAGVAKRGGGKAAKLVMLLGLVNKLMCAKSFGRNQSKPMTGFEIPA